MRRPSRPGVPGVILFGVLSAALLAVPAPVNALGPVVSSGLLRATPRSGSTTADLSVALAADGTFRGIAGLSGTVDGGAWTLVSDLSSGDAPRFAPATGGTTPAATTPIGPWSSLGSNGSGDGALDNAALAITVSGTDLYVGGFFHDAAGIAAADFVARWNGSAWSALGSNSNGNGALNGGVRALTVAGGDLFVGGDFKNAAGIATADFVTRWDGSWHALGSNHAGNGAIAGLGAGEGTVKALASSGSDVYVGGVFFDAAKIHEADFVARWNGSAWSALGDNGAGDGAIGDWACDPDFPETLCQPSVETLAMSGSSLYVGGDFGDVAGEGAADYVARWDGGAWLALGADGADDGALDYIVYALAVSGADLYVGGDFQEAGGIATADFIAKWNGSAWSGLGTNGAGNGALHGGGVRAIAISGTDVYAGGDFTNVAGIAKADFMAKWSGSSWSALGSNGAGGGALDESVLALTVSAGGVYAGGWFANAAGLARADFVATWSPGITLQLQPDARIRVGTGPYAGDGVHNATGTGQSKTVSALPTTFVAFGISIKNGGNGTDRFTVNASGANVTGYTVKYFRRSTDITSAVVAGTFQTPTLEPGATYLITAIPTIKSRAAQGSKLTRLVTIASAGDGSKVDAVKFTVKRL